MGMDMEDTEIIIKTIAIDDGQNRIKPNVYYICIIYVISGIKMLYNNVYKNVGE